MASQEDLNTLLSWFSAHETLLLILAAIATVLGAVLIPLRTMLVVVAKKLTRRRQQILRESSFFARVSFKQERFVDRVDIISHLVTSMAPSRQLWNLYGDKGVGKTEMLKILCDIFNGSLRASAAKDLSRARPTGAIADYRALYFDLSDRTGLRDMEEELLQRTFPRAGLAPTIESFAAQISEALGHRPLLLVFDNLNNPGIAHDLTGLIDRYLRLRARDVIIVGSVRPIVLYSHSVTHVHLAPLTQADTSLYATKNGLCLGPGEALALFESTRGLPIYLEMLVGAQSDEGPEKLLLDVGLRNVVERLCGTLTEGARQTLLYVASLGLSRTEIPVTLVAQLLQVPTVSVHIAELEAASFLVSRRDRGRQFLKLHDLVRDLVLQAHLPEILALNDKIGGHLLGEGRAREATLHFLMSEDPGLYSDQIVVTLNAAIEEDNLPFLVAVGEALRQLTDLRPSRVFPPLLRGAVVNAYLFAVMGVGDYQDAQHLVQSVNLNGVPQRSLREIRSAQDFHFHYLVADLDHLQNKYTQSVEMFKVLLQLAEREFPQFAPRCLERIAHAYRHQGKRLSEAEESFEEAARRASEVGDLQTWGRSLNGVVCIRLLTHDLRFPFLDYLNAAYQVAANAAAPQSLLFSTMKYHSMYLRRIHNTTDAMQRVIDAAAGFRKLGKRLIYNLEFEFGEVYRLRGEPEAAIAAYGRALDFGTKNNDRNLRTASQLGLVLTELAVDRLIYHQSEEERLKTLGSALMVASEADIQVTQLQARMILDFLDGGVRHPVWGVDEDFPAFLESVGLRQEGDICRNCSRDALGKMQLILL